MLLPREYQDFSNGMTYSEATINGDFIVVFADDYFYNFAGRQIGIKLTEIINPENVEEFKTGVLSLKPGESIRFILNIMGKDNLYHLNDVTVFDNNRMLGNDRVYDIKFYNLISMEYRFINHSNNINKYKTLLSMYNDHLFDYDFEKDVFTILVYDSLKANVFMKDTFENVKKRILAAIDDPGMAQNFVEFMDKVKEGSQGFLYDLFAPDFVDRNRTVHYTITCRSMYKHNRQKIVMGVIRTDDFDNDIPFYERPEGKDFFTGVYNKKACQSLTKDMIANNTEALHYMVVMDVDDFKNVNDRYGHLFGDEVILKMAAIISKAVVGRGIVGRFGGDEFFILTNGIKGEPELRSMLTYLRKMMQVEFAKEFGKGGLTCSMGVSSYPTDGKTYDELFYKADKCLYIAKEKGKNRFIIYDEEKHGQVNEEDGKINAGVIEGRKSNEEVVEILQNVIVDFGRNGAEAIDRNLPLLCEALSIGAIRIYNRNKREVVKQFGEYGDLKPTIDVLLDDELIIKHWGGKKFWSIAQISNIEQIAPSVYRTQKDAGIGGYYACRYNNSKGDEIMVFFDNLDEKSNATQSDRNYMLLITGILAELL